MNYNQNYKNDLYISNSNDGLKMETSAREMH